MKKMILNLIPLKKLGPMRIDPKVHLIEVKIQVKRKMPEVSKKVIKILIQDLIFLKISVPTKK